MRITAELSLYPLASEAITVALHHRGSSATCESQPGLDLMTNQMSTQLRGEMARRAASCERLHEGR